MKINLHLWDTNNRKDQCTHTNTQIYVNHPKQRLHSGACYNFIMTIEKINAHTNKL